MDTGTFITAESRSNKSSSQKKLKEDTMSNSQNYRSLEESSENATDNFNI